MKSNFEWDEKKAKSNIQKHGVTFEEATTVLQDELSLTMNDIAHSTDRNVLLISDFHPTGIY